jgi:hypothetical protein
MDSNSLSSQIHPESEMIELPTIAVIIIGLYLLSSIKVLAEYERGVIFRLGRFRKPRDGASSGDKQGRSFEYAPYHFVPGDEVAFLTLCNGWENGTRTASVYSIAPETRRIAGLIVEAARRRVIRRYIRTPQFNKPDRRSP